ncbi:MAG: fibro-slime domain-containing protein [Fibrobacteres bacterium]|nr:fibro-slime domain-containing protein [Fibrobacterota bacterium]
MASASRVLRFILFGLLVVLSFPKGAHAEKTLMWLLDWYSTNMDSVIRFDSAYIPHYNGTTGNYFGNDDKLLVQTNAYAPGMPIPVAKQVTGGPTTIERWWFSLPSWNSAQYNGGLIDVRAKIKIAQHTNYGTLAIDTSRFERLATGELNRAQTSLGVPGSIDSCVNTLKGDTVWIRSNPNPIWQNYTGPDKLACFDHNPFLELVGTVHVLNPWPGKPVFILMGGKYYPTFPDPDRPGWLSTTLYAIPASGQTFTVRVTNSNAGTGQFLDAGGLNGNATGVPFDLTAAGGTKKEVWIVPPLVAATSTVTGAAPAVAMNLYVQNPKWSSTTLRVQMQGQDARFVPSITKYCEWYQLTFYAGAVPSKVVIRQPFADTLYGSKGMETAPVSMASYTNWIAIPPGSTSLWLSTPFNGFPLTNAGPTPPPGTGTCDKKVLAFSGYDYTSGDAPTSPTFYPPFAETNSGVNYPGTTTTTDNCTHSGGGVTTGLVKPVLNARGRPEWSGKVDCDIGKTTDGPQYWFDSLWKSSTGVISNTKSAGATQMNAFHCIRDTLTLDATGYYRTSQKDSLNYFPFDTATSVPAPFRQGNPDYHFAMHAKAAFEYTPGLKFTFAGDDDLWIFIDKKLALDLGGQHGRQKGVIDLDGLGLIEGKSYQFDMFYTERHTTGSEMFMSTTMNLVPTINVNFDTSNATAGAQDYVMSTATTTNRPDVCPEEGAATATVFSPARASIVLYFPDGSMQNLDSTFNAAYPGIVISGNNSHLNVDTLKIQRSGRLSLSGAYQIVASVGTESRSISFSVVSNSVDVVGTLFDRDGNGRADSVALHVDGSGPAFKVVASAVVRWADSTGLPDSVAIAGTSFVHFPGDSVIGAPINLPFRTSCPPAGCSGPMGLVITSQGGSTLLNRVKILADGIPPVALAAWLVYDTTGAPNAMDSLFVRTSEVVVGGAVPPWVIVGQSAAGRPVTTTGDVAGGTLVKIAFDPGSNPIVPGDSLRLGAGLPDAIGNAPGARSRWVPITSNPVAKAWILDTTGDGTADVIHIGSKGSLSGATSALVHWRTASGSDTSFTIATPGGLGASLAIPVGALLHSTYGVGYTLDVTVGAQLKRFPLLDSMAPVATKAALRYGIQYDTLIVTASETVMRGSGASAGWFAQKSVPSQGANGPQVNGTILSNNGGILVMLVTPGSVDGDSLRLRGWSGDEFGNVPGDVSMWVPIDYGPQPIRVQVYDVSGDGHADKVVFRLLRSAIKRFAPTRFGLVWGGNFLSIPGLTASSDGMSWSGAVGPFPFGTQPSPGDSGWIVVGNDSTSFRAAVDDSVPPVAVRGSLVFGFDEGSPDTLVVNGSEGLALSGSAFVLLNSDSSETGATSPLAAQILSSSVATGPLRLVVSSGSIPNTATWIRFGTSVSDGHAAVGSHSKWVRLVVIPSGRAALYDTDGDGKANFVSVRMRGTMQATEAILTWAGQTQTWRIGGSRTGNYTLSPSDSGLWFAKGATACGTSPCIIRFMADQTEITTWTLIDSVAPMVVAAHYSYGDTTSDTLRVRFSEPMKVVSSLSSWVEWGSTASVGAVTHDAPVATLAADGVNAILVLSGANIAGTDWDKIRIATGALAGKIQDAAGVSAGTASPFAPLTFGLPPMISAVSDPDGQGRATHVSISTLRDVSPLSLAAIKSWTIEWSGAKLVVDVAALPQTSPGHWSGALSSPFALGVTSCEGPCSATATGATDQRSLVKLIDSVPPSLISAKFRYSRPEVIKDTLIFELSEPWPAQQPGDLVTALVMLGRLSDSAREVTPMLHWYQTGERTFVIVVDTTWQRRLHRGDSARLSYNGGLSLVLDKFGNRVGKLSRWVPLEFGERPLELIIRQEHAILVNGRDKAEPWTEPAADVPGLEMLVRDDLSGDYVQVDGTIKIGPDGTVTGTTPPKNNPARTMDVYIKLNRPLDGTIFVYDNMGVGVRQLDLSDLIKLWPAGSEDVQREIKISWNGTDYRNKFVAGGVYLMRAFVKYRNRSGKQDFKNLLWKYGWIRESVAK